jgi:hypothetical protein
LRHTKVFSFLLELPTEDLQHIAKSSHTSVHSSIFITLLSSGGIRVKTQPQWLLISLGHTGLISSVRSYELRCVEYQFPFNSLTHTPLAIHLGIYNTHRVRSYELSYSFSFSQDHCATNKPQDQRCDGHTRASNLHRL